MIKIKILNDIKKIHLKIFGSFPKIVLSNNQEKEATPTKETQEILPDKEYDGLSKVIIKPIPDEYIIPQGDLEISQNGTYDVTNYASANVNVPEKQLGTKTITSNGIYKAIDDNLDGYSGVEVATSGVDINDYIENTIVEGNGSSISAGQWIKSVKKLPAFTFNGKNTSYHFSGFKGGSIDLSNFNTSNVTNMSYMFSDCSSLTSLDLSSFNTSKVTNMGTMFSYCSKLTSLNLSNFNTSNVTNMYHMFERCSSLTSLNLGSFNTSKVTNMSAMFSYCSKLTSLNLSNFDTSNVTNMSNMFSSCSKLTSLDLSNFNTSKVTNMQHMFYMCYDLTSLDVSSFNTSKVTYMQGMFSNCSSLTSLDLSGFNTLKITNMSYLFDNCTKLKNLNISNFDLTKVTIYTNMFYSVPNDCYILVKDTTAKEWITSKFTNLTNVHYVGE